VIPAVTESSQTDQTTPDPAGPPSNQPPPVTESAPSVPVFTPTPPPANPWPTSGDQMAPIGFEPTTAGPTDPLFLTPAPTAEMAAVPPAPRRRGRAGVIAMSVVNFLLLAVLGGAVFVRMQFQDQWEADRADRAGQISDVRGQTTAVEGRIRDREAEQADFTAKEAEAVKREPAEEACLKAVREVITKLDNGEKNIVLTYDDPCGVPVSGRWTISNE
jgi:hypothetical protein